MLNDQEESATTITAAGALGSAVGSVVYAGGLKRPLFVGGCTAAGIVAFFCAGQKVLEEKMQRYEV